MRITIVLCFVAVTCAFGFAQKPEPFESVNDFRARERQIAASTPQEYRLAFDELAQEALKLAESKITSAESEELMHWVVKGGRNSKTAHRATELLLQHHSASPASIRKLLSYAINPNACSPRLFRGFAKATVPEEQRWIVSATSAIHQKSLLLIADEIAADPKAASQFQVTLGRELTNDLAEKDRQALEARVITEFGALAARYGEKRMGGMSVEQLAEGSIFAVQHLRLGKLAKGLSGTALDGTALDLEDFQGKALLIDFWATWCAPCVTAMPELKKLSREIAPSKFAILGISADRDIEALRSFVKDKAVTWDIIADRDGVLQKRWQSLSLPTYFVLDEHGVVQFRGTDHFGAIRAVKSIVGSAPNGGVPATAVDEIAKQILSAHDSNKNGRIEKTELPKEARANFESADTNKDAGLTLDELTEFLRTGTTTSEAVDASPTQPEPDAPDS